MEEVKVCPECGDTISAALARAVCNECDVLYEVKATAKKPAAKKKYSRKKV